MNLKQAILLILGWGALAPLALAQPITATYTRGCAPFDVSLDTTALNGQAYVIRYEPGQTPVVGLTYTYTDPGTYSLEVITQSTSPYTISITVDEPVGPTFDVLTCSQHEVQVQLINPQYDRYWLIFNDTDTLQGYDSVTNYQYGFGSAGSFPISVQGYYLDGDQNCPVTTTQVTTRDTLLAPTYSVLTPLAANQLESQVVLTPDTDHRLNYGEESTVLLGQVELDGAGANTYCTSVGAANWHCAQVEAYDVCTGRIEQSEMLCTAQLTATAFPQYNEITWAGPTRAGVQYSLLKNGVTLGTYTAANTTITDSAVECNVQYVYQLQVTHPLGGIAYSLEDSVLGLAPGTPQTLTEPLASVTGNAVGLTWQAASFPEADTYFISRAGVLIDSVTAPTLAYQDDQADPATASVCYTLTYRDVCQNVSMASPDGCSIHLAQGGAIGTDVLVEWTSFVGPSTLPKLLF